jgi:hypothetical protein
MARRLHDRRDARTREMTFVVGGTLVVGLGVALAAGLAWAGAGWFFFQAWVGAAVAVGLGGFFVSVGVAERRERCRLLREFERGAPPGAPPRP